jgi:TfoX N-terminal domain
VDQVTAVTDRLVRQVGAVQRQRVPPDDVRLPGGFANGNLFIGLHQNDFIMRLSEEDRTRFSAEFGEPMKGRRMREYVRLPEELMTDTRKRAPWIKRSPEYAEGIKPKARCRKWHPGSAGT